MNSIRCTNFMLKSAGLPNSCLYFGSLCEDEIGNMLKEGVEKEGMKANFSIAEDSYTGKCACVVTDKERALCADLGSCMQYKDEHMVSNISQAESAKIVYTTGFFITSNYRALIDAAKYALWTNKIFAVNLSAVFLVAGHTEEYTEILKYADYVFGNEEETDAFAKAHGVEYSNLAEVGTYIAKLEKYNKKPRTVITTCGKDPVLYSIHDFSTDETTKKEFPVDLVEKD